MTAFGTYDTGWRGASDNRPLNYEETARYDLMVTVSDQGEPELPGLSVTFGIRVDIEDVNEAPRFEGEEDPYLIAVRGRFGMVAL